LIHTGLTKCQSLRNEALGIGKTGNASVMPLAGRYVPQCNTDGKFQQIQCYGSTGYCWCVDSYGSPVLGTIVRGKPHCKSSDVGGRIEVAYMFTASNFFVLEDIFSFFATHDHLA
jgi:hypothetical protein